MLSDWIERAFLGHFMPGDGDEVATIIEDIAGLSPELATEIADALMSTAAYMASGGETFYDCDEGYVVARFHGGDHRWRWQRFAATVRAEARFFNRTAEAWLDQIFGPLGDDRTWHGRAVIKTLTPGEPDTAFYRARHVPSAGKAWDILDCPSAELGPLPLGQGVAGRMNAAGVSVFYGAMDVDTCIAEIRPPVGSLVLSARFDLLRPVQVLDLDLLETVEARGSDFDPDYDQKRERAAFLRAFGQLIAQPVMPDDEAFRYLPTQIIADYLAQRSEPVVDGILYRSTQTDGKGRNIVLFNRSARVERRDEAHPVGPLRDFGPGPLDLMSDTAPAPAEPARAVPDGDDDRELTLRLVLDSVQVSEIRATRYEEVRRTPAIWRMELDDRERERDREKRPALLAALSERPCRRRSGACRPAAHLSLPAAAR